MSGSTVTAVAFWFAMAAVLLAGAAMVYVGLVRDMLRRNRGPRCPKCWYDLRGVPDPDPNEQTCRVECPECGRVITKWRQLGLAQK